MLFQNNKKPLKDLKTTINYNSVQKYRPSTVHNAKQIKVFHIFSS